MIVHQSPNCNRIDTSNKLLQYTVTHQQNNKQPPQSPIWPDALPKKLSCTHPQRQLHQVRIHQPSITHIWSSTLHQLYFVVSVANATASAWIWSHRKGIHVAGNNSGSGLNTLHLLLLFEDSLFDNLNEEKFSHLSRERIHWMGWWMIQQYR